MKTEIVGGDGTFDPSAVTPLFSWMRTVPCPGMGSLCTKERNDLIEAVEMLKRRILCCLKVFLVLYSSTYSCI